MYNINNARLGDDNNIDLPLTQLPKRKYTIWLNSWGGTQIFGEGVGQEAGEQTFAMKYTLPFPLKSKTNFFNVSVVSMALGHQQRNFTKRDAEDPPAGNTFYVWTYIPVNTSFIVNIKCSSAYNGYVGDTGGNITIPGSLAINGPASQIVQGPPMISEKDSSQNAYALISGISPIGSFSLRQNRTGATSTNGNFFGTASGSVALVAPIDICIPDTCFNNNEITVVLTTQFTQVTSVVTVNPTPGWPDTLNRLNIPLLINANAPDNNQNFPLPIDFRLWNLPYIMCLQFTEC